MATLLTLVTNPGDGRTSLVLLGYSFTANTSPPGAAGRNLEVEQDQMKKETKSSPLSPLILKQARRVPWIASWCWKQVW